MASEQLIWQGLPRHRLPRINMNTTVAGGNHLESILVQALPYPVMGKKPKEGLCAVNNGLRLEAPREHKRKFWSPLRPIGLFFRPRRLQIQIKLKVQVMEKPVSSCAEEQELGGGVEKCEARTGERGFELRAGQGKQVSLTAPVAPDIRTQGVHSPGGIVAYDVDAIGPPPSQPEINSQKPSHYVGRSQNEYGTAPLTVLGESSPTGLSSIAEPVGRGFLCGRPRSIASIDSKRRNMYNWIQGLPSYVDAAFAPSSGLTKRPSTLELRNSSGDGKLQPGFVLDRLEGNREHGTGSKHRGFLRSQVECTGKSHHKDLTGSATITSAITAEVPVVPVSQFSKRMIWAKAMADRDERERDQSRQRRARMDWD